MHIDVTFPGGVRVDATYHGFTIHTDQPPSAGGEGGSPAPFDLFLASMATCAGYYALQFCRQRGIGTEGLHVALSGERDEQAHLYRHLQVEVTLPEGFPARYTDAIRRAVDQCTVKRHLLEPPKVATVVMSRDAEAAALFA